MITTQEGVEVLSALALRFADVAREHPGSTIVRAQNGNLSIFDADGKYIGFADVIHGNLRMIAGKGVQG